MGTVELVAVHNLPDITSPYLTPHPRHKNITYWSKRIWVLHDALKYEIHTWKECALFEVCLVTCNAESDREAPEHYYRPYVLEALLPGLDWSLESYS